MLNINNDNNLNNKSKKRYIDVHLQLLEDAPHTKFLEEHNFDQELINTLLYLGFKFYHSQNDDEKSRKLNELLFSKVENLFDKKTFNENQNLSEVITRSKNEIMMEVNNIKSLFDNSKKISEIRENSTQGGFDFQKKALNQIAEYTTDNVVDEVGEQKGKFNKKGDGIIILSENYKSAGSNIVIEAKNENNWTIEKAREELRLAKENRCSINGIFVLSTYKASETIPNLYIDGKDVFVRWHPNSESHHLYLDVGVQVALALANLDKKNKTSPLSIQELEISIDSIVKQTSNLDKMEGYCNTIERANENNRSEAGKIKKELFKSIQNLKAFSIDAKEAI